MKTHCYATLLYIIIYSFNIHPMQTKISQTLQKKQQIMRKDIIKKFGKNKNFTALFCRDTKGTFSFSLKNDVQKLLLYKSKPYSLPGGMQQKKFNIVATFKKYAQKLDYQTIVWFEQTNKVQNIHFNINDCIILPANLPRKAPVTYHDPNNWAVLDHYNLFKIDLDNLSIRKICKVDIELDKAKESLPYDKPDNVYSCIRGIFAPMFDKLIALNKNDPILQKILSLPLTKTYISSKNTNTIKFKAITRQSQDYLNIEYTITYNKQNNSCTKKALVSILLQDIHTRFFIPLTDQKALSFLLEL